MNNKLNQDISTKQNLKDAGCTVATIKNFLQLQTAGKNAQQIQLLIAQRRLLLNAIHQKQRNLDCLDHLLFTIKNIENKIPKGVYYHE